VECRQVGKPGKRRSGYASSHRPGRCGGAGVGFEGRVVLSLKEDWDRDGVTIARGSVILARPEALHPGAEGEARQVELLVEPSSETVVEEVNAAGDGILITVLENVRGRLYRYREEPSGWRREEIPFPDNGALHVATTDDDDLHVLADGDDILGMLHLRERQIRHVAEPVDPRLQLDGPSRSTKRVVAVPSTGGAGVEPRTGATTRWTSWSIRAASKVCSFWRQPTLPMKRVLSRARLMRPPFRTVLPVL